MGRKWYNSNWDQNIIETGIKFEFTMPYAHQQNGIAEQGICTILNANQSAMVESDLSLKYQVDIVQTVVYVYNFISSARQLRKILISAELWTECQQNIFYLLPYGAIVYAHIPMDLITSKLSVKQENNDIIDKTEKEDDLPLVIKKIC